MNILIKWGLRVHGENPLHIRITVLDMVFTYTLLYSTSYIVNNSIRNHGSDGIGLLWYISLLLVGVLIVTSLLTMYNAFSVSIQERRARYVSLSTCGATVHQIRRGLFFEAFLLDCAGLVFGIALGVLLCSFLKLDKPELPAYIQRVQPRTVYCLITEFLSVLAAMGLACRRHLGRLREAPVSSKPVREYAGTHKAFLLGRLFQIGGNLSILLHRHDKKTRASFLPALVMSIAGLLIMANVFAILRDAQLIPQGAGVYLYTLGRNSVVDSAADSFFADPQTRVLANRIDSYQTFAPCVYCVFNDEQVSQPVKNAQHAFNPLRLFQGQMHVYARESGADARYYVMPRIVFLENSAYRAFAERQHIRAGETDGIWLRDVMFRGKPVSWLADSGEQAQLDMFFYTSDHRFEIDANKPKATDEERQEQKKIVRCRDLNEFLEYTETLPKQTKRVRIAGVACEPESLFWDLDCSVPTLVFSEKAKALFSTDTLERSDTGSSYTVYFDTQTKAQDGGKNGSLCDRLLEWIRGVLHKKTNRQEENPRYRLLVKRLYDALHTQTDGYIAEHTFGEGTIYIACAEKTVQADLIPNYEVPLKPIYADLNTTLGMWTDKFQSYTLPLFFAVFIGLTLFTLFTNIVNVVFANHILYQREYAMLESIGMDEQQNRSLVLYEGARYSILTVCYSVLAALVIYPSFSIALSYGMRYEFLQGGPHEDTSPALWSGYIFADAVDAMHKTAMMCAERWWFFLLAGLAVYGLFYLTNHVTSRRMRLKPGEMIMLLKRDI